MKVVVIGAGIVGLLTACRLKQRGVDVVVLEKGKVGQQSSWAGAGILCPIHPWLYPDAFSDLVNASLDLYEDLEQELKTETSHNIERIKSGLLIPCFADDGVQHQNHAKAWSEKFSWDMDCVSAKKAQGLEPALSDQVSEALVWPDVYQVRNPELLKAVSLLLKKLQVEVIEDCEVRTLIEGNENEIKGVTTASGATYEADAVLMAAGGWSNGLAEQSGFSLPVYPVKGQIVLLKTQQGSLRHIVKHDDAYFVPRQDGRILVGASLENAGFETGVTVEAVHQLLASTLKLLPGLRHAQIEQQWMGFRPGSPDGLPFLGPIAAKKGLWVATGHYRNGVALAPITANVMADWVMGVAPTLEMSPFLPEREVKLNADIGYPA